MSTTSRRRQQSGQALLNEVFGNIIDSSICFDKTKVFHQQVKKKDAPNYYDVIKNPICLMDMKNKAKRQEYMTKDSLVKDIALMRENAERFNGPQHPIAFQARDLEQHAHDKLSELEQDIKNFELLV